MAEKTADLVCRRLGISRPCLTRTQPLAVTQPAKWTQPGLAPKLWLKHHEPEDILLCECEMVPKSAVDAIIDSIREQNGRPDLNAIALRSRIGKGACQGTFCGVRVTSYMYDQGELESEESLTNLRGFLSQRWKGQHPTLWDKQLIQAELLEALYCGFFGLELVDVIVQEYWNGVTKLDFTFKSQIAKLKYQINSNDKIQNIQTV